MGKTVLITGGSRGIGKAMVYAFSKAGYNVLLNFNRSENIANDIAKELHKNHVLQQFIEFCDAKGIKRRNNMILKSQPLLESTIYGNIVYNILDTEEYVKYINHDDATVHKAIELFNAKQTTPRLSPHDKAGNKKTACNKVQRIIRNRRIA